MLFSKRCKYTKKSAHTQGPGQKKRAQNHLLAHDVANWCGMPLGRGVIHRCTKVYRTHYHGCTVPITVGVPCPLSWVYRTYCHGCTVLIVVGVPYPLSWVYRTYYCRCTVPIVVGVKHPWAKVFNTHAGRCTSLVSRRLLTSSSTGGIHRCLWCEPCGCEWSSWPLWDSCR